MKDKFYHGGLITTSQREEMRVTLIYPDNLSICVDWVRVGGNSDDYICISASTGIQKDRDFYSIRVKDLAIFLLDNKEILDKLCNK